MSLLAASAVVPSLLLIWYFHSRDVYPEPPRVLWTTFGLGVLICVPVVPAALLLSAGVDSIGSTTIYGFAEAFLGAAIPEEVFKFLVVYLYCARHAEFDEPMDGIVYGAVASLGFATLENILYVSDGGLGTAVMRALTAVPFHGFTGAIMGYFIGQARFSEQPRPLLVKALVIPVVLHGMYDFPLLALKRAGELGAGDTPFALVLIVPPILIFEWVWSVRLVSRLRAAQLTSQPVDGGAIQVAGTTPAPTRGGAAGWFMLVVGGLIATAGGLVTLGVLLALATGEVDGGELVPLTVGTAMIGGVPLLVGAALFRAGLLRLNRGEQSRPAAGLT